jgi:hypothetical protein
MVLQHAGNIQPLGDDRLVLTDQPGAELMEVVLAAITHPKVLAGQLMNGFPAVLAALLFTTYRPLQARQPVLGLLQVPGIGNGFPRTQGGKCLDAYIHSNTGMDSLREGSDIGFYVTPRGIAYLLSNQTGLGLCSNLMLWNSTISGKQWPPIISTGKPVA